MSKEQISPVGNCNPLSFIAEHGLEAAKVNPKIEWKALPLLHLDLH